MPEAGYFQPPRFEFRLPYKPPHRERQSQISTTNTALAYCDIPSISVSNSKNKLVFINFSEFFLLF
jgi:hypothetical protein